MLEKFPSFSNSKYQKKFEGWSCESPLTDCILATEPLQTRTSNAFAAGDGYIRRWQLGVPSRIVALASKYEVCKLCNETGSVVFDLSTLRKWDMEGRSDNEQRCAIKFCFRLRHNATETFPKLQQAYGDSVLSRAQVFRRFKAFSEGRESLEDEPRNGRPPVSKTAENVVRVRDLVHSDRRLTIRMIGEELNLNRTTFHQILTNELKMRKICAKIVPKNLSR
ncbi:protein GVQW3 [Trichonephila clavipes]|nr:protein GVQW3 [Trichonephila clavipes]